MGTPVNQTEYLNRKFNRLTVVGFETGKRGSTICICECECNSGKMVKAAPYQIKSGNTKSCGCLKSENAAALKRTHGLCGTRQHRIWEGMKQRCYDKNAINYSHYGAKGIGICDDWRNDFQAFYDWSVSNGYEEHLTLERMDSTRNYRPENCIWATRTEQQRNKKAQSRNISGVCGVNFDKSTGKWIACIYANEKNHHLGSYDTIEEAAKMRKAAELEHWGNK